MEEFDLCKTLKRPITMTINLDKQHLELIGSRILSELNDLRDMSLLHKLNIPLPQCRV